MSEVKGPEEIQRLILQAFNAWDSGMHTADFTYSLINRIIGKTIEAAEARGYARAIEDAAKFVRSARATNNNNQYVQYAGGVLGLIEERIRALAPKGDAK